MAEVVARACAVALVVGRAAVTSGSPLPALYCQLVAPAHLQPPSHPSNHTLQVKDSVAAAVILKAFFEDPGAALLVRAARPRRQPGSRQGPRPQQQQQSAEQQQEPAP